MYKDPVTPKDFAIDTVGERIRSTRKAWRWSQERLAKTLGCDQATVSFWEMSRITMSGTAMVAICALFGCSRRVFETGVGFVVPAAPANLPAFQEEEW